MRTKFDICDFIVYLNIVFKWFELAIMCICGIILCTSFGNCCCGFL